MRSNRPLALLVVATSLVGCKPHPKTPETQAAPPLAFCAPRPAAAPAPKQLADYAQGAQLFEGLGTFHRTATSNAEAQQYFDQGMRLTWAFNHDEATRSFVKAGLLAPDCAICWWGAALTLGPNYNVPMLPDRAQAAWEALAKAQATAAKATPVDQALIKALGQRYVSPEPLDPVAMAPHQVAFSNAMREVAKQYPEDLDVQTLFAEALMTSNPWKLWDLAGKPSPGTPEIVETLERVLAKNPLHPGANHYYIHAVEASPTPQKGVPAAERLGPLMMAAGHLRHMPGHIFQRVGRYEDAVQANRDGIAADNGYLARTSPPGYYPMYLAHNYAFLAFAASMEGRSQEAIQAARTAYETTPKTLVDFMPGFDFYVSYYLPTMVRFGQWEALLKEPAPDPKYPLLSGFHHFAHAYALAATGKIDAAEAERAALAASNTKLPADLTAGLNTAKDVMAVADAVLLGRVAQAAGKADAARTAYEQAVKLEDALAYDEPADWFFPARHLLGRALLEAGDAADAEAVYREDLRRHPDNGWALVGLAQALRAQKKGDEAAVTEARFKAVWAKADISLSASAL